VSASEPDETPGAAAARAYRELETLVRHLADELAGFRRRALAAEAELRARTEEQAAAEVDSSAAAPAEAAPAGPDGEAAAARIAELERENAELRRRVEQAGARTRQLLERVRFLRQQHPAGG
jgi:hypothetical protein